MALLLLAYYLLSPPLLGVVLGRVATRRVLRSPASREEAVRRQGRLLALPWLLYLLNLLGGAAYLGSGGFGGLEELAGAPAATGGAVVVALGPTLLVGLVWRAWLRRVGHPGGAFGYGLEVRGWAVHVAFLGAVLAVGYGTSLVLPGWLAVVAIAAVMSVYLTFYPEVLAWIWRAVPLGADEGMGPLVWELVRAQDAPLRGVLLLPTPRGAPANAFAAGILPGRRFLFLTEGLLERFEVEETRAVVAHEIGHLRRGHVLRITGMGLLASLVVAVPLFSLVAFTLPDSHPALRTPLFGLAGGLTALAALFVTRRLQHRSELEADDFSANVLGSGKPMARALRRLARENWLPQGEEGPGLLASHPTIAHRVRRLEGRAEEEAPGESPPET